MDFIFIGLNSISLWFFVREFFVFSFIIGLMDLKCKIFFFRDFVSFFIFFLGIVSFGINIVF